MSQLAIEYLPSGVVVLTIDRPHRRNALDNQTVAELHTVLDEVNGKPNVRAVVITGAGAGFSPRPPPKGGRNFKQAG
nr:enoyl-CoA hydratase/isomerase family protein [Nocardia flavorosea]